MNYSAGFFMEISKNAVSKIFINNWSEELI